MRARRAALDDDDQAAATMAVLTRLARMAVVREARTVAGYRAVRGEVDIEATLIFLAEAGATITTPRVMGEHLEFIVTDEETPTTAGSFGIPEPAYGRAIPIERHDLVLVPLVAFDAAGNRLGQGGGFYDRALAATARRQLPDRPVRVGVAHSFQQIGEVPTEAWDVRLDAIVTEDGVIEVTPGIADRTS
jgi:5-formyltetrahydrofolate cyclo-ligase